MQRQFINPLPQTPTLLSGWFIFRQSISCSSCFTTTLIEVFYLSPLICIHPNVPNAENQTKSSIQSVIKFQYETDFGSGIQQAVYNSQDQVKVLFSSPDLTFWTISNNNNNGRKDSREDSRVVNFILQILWQTPKQFYEAIK